MIITIDGVAWSGKSTISKALARLTNCNHINTGAMFRAIANKVLKNGFSLDDSQKVIELAKDTSIRFEKDKIIIDGEDLTDELNNPSIVPAASKIAKIPELREIMMKIQRDVGREGNVIFEGRDMGTIVFPNADFKFYIDASMNIRIKRFFKTAKGEEKDKYSEEEVKKIIEKIDYEDKNRKIAPLKIPEDAIIYDNTDSPTAEQDAVVLWYYITHKEEILKNSKIIKNEGS